MADRWGVDRSYVDAMGVEHIISDDIAERLRQIIGESGPVERPLVVGAGQPVQLGDGQIRLEDGTALVVAGTQRDLPLGYHHFEGDDGVSRRIIVSPRKCHLPEGWHAWGWAAQLYATRSSESWGMGDLGDLAQLARWSRTLGAGFVLVNPLNAVAPIGTQQPSPYYPASRRYRSPIYLRVADVPAPPGATNAVGQMAAVGRALNDDRTIDRDEVWRIKLAALDAIWQETRDHREFDAWLRAQPASLQQFATWSVLAEHHGPNFREWPAHFGSPEDSGVAPFAARHADRVRFHAWLQWLVATQLDAASRELAVVHDLPIGVDPQGFDAWAWQDTLALDASVGAPPDAFNRHGQDWGLPPFVPWRLQAANYQPFIDTIRSTISSGGGLRIDHVMGLFRLWWIPTGSSPNEGGYVRYPAEDLLAIVALESYRARAVVVGEDLGTVEDAVRTSLADHDILSYRLLWFEEDDPSLWPHKAMAAITTHDLPTVAGLWNGADVESQQKAGLEPDSDGINAIRDRLADATGLPTDASASEAVLAAHRLLARTPAVMVAATLDDAVAEPERPNMPGADEYRANWCLALPIPLEAIQADSLVLEIAGVLDASRRESSPSS